MSHLPQTSTNAASEPALGCQHCFARKQCGGLYFRGGLDCLCYCCQEPETCTYLCPHSKNFLNVWRDTNGLDLTIKQIKQQEDRLPEYIPLIQHGNRRTGFLNLPIAALTTFAVTRRIKQRNDMLRDPDDLRRRFRLTLTTPLILSSIAKDDHLERFWKYRTERRLVEGIAMLKPTHVIAPNFSLFRDVPRFDNLANIKRSLLCAEEFSNAGISVIPYVAGITTTDWETWTAFLREHANIAIICKEFQTGASTKAKGTWHLRQLDRLQQNLGRPLHVVAIGGRRYLRALRAFAGVTVIDSNPFMRTMYRRLLTTTGWKDASTPIGAPLDRLLETNIAAYAQRMQRQAAGEEQSPSRPPMTKMEQPTSQLAFGFATPTSSTQENQIPLQHRKAS
ncbi:MAG TPA: DUF4417 domain-containing protein [Candidatus Sulfotelmatobacter sp.]|jgi:hypothetical protein|nr:DUF4417 domain-containing protein [Candidatus Sulfotelmatobacter sp.]